MKEKLKKIKNRIVLFFKKRKGWFPKFKKNESGLAVIPALLFVALFWAAVSTIVVVVPKVIKGRNPDPGFHYNEYLDVDSWQNLISYLQEEVERVEKNWGYIITENEVIKPKDSPRSEVTDEYLIKAKYRPDEILPQILRDKGGRTYSLYYGLGMWPYEVYNEFIRFDIVNIYYLEGERYVEFYIYTPGKSLASDYLYTNVDIDVSSTNLSSININGVIYDNLIPVERKAEKIITNEENASPYSITATYKISGANYYERVQTVHGFEWTPDVSGSGFVIIDSDKKPYGIGSTYIFKEYLPDGINFVNNYSAPIFLVSEERITDKLMDINSYVFKDVNLDRFIDYKNGDVFSVIDEWFNWSPGMPHNNKGILGGLDFWSENGNRNSISKKYQGSYETGPYSNFSSQSHYLQFAAFNFEDPYFNEIVDNILGMDFYEYVCDVRTNNPFLSEDVCKSFRQKYRRGYVARNESKLQVDSRERLYNGISAVGRVDSITDEQFKILGFSDNDIAAFRSKKFYYFIPGVQAGYFKNVYTYQEVIDARIKNYFGSIYEQLLKLQENGILLELQDGSQVQMDFAVRARYQNPSDGYNQPGDFENMRPDDECLPGDWCIDSRKPGKGIPWPGNGGDFWGKLLKWFPIIMGLIFLLVFSKPIVFILTIILQPIAWIVSKLFNTNRRPKKNKKNKGGGDKNGKKDNKNI